MRGSDHAKEIRRFTSDAKGMHLGAPFGQVASVFETGGNE